jgi:hypothetical protein
MTTGGVVRWMRSVNEPAINAIPDQSHVEASWLKYDFFQLIFLAPILEQV